MDVRSVFSFGLDSGGARLLRDAARKPTRTNELRDARNPDGSPLADATAWELAYLAQHTVLWSTLKPLWRQWHGHDLEPFEADFHALLERDISHVLEGRYPRSLLFGFPISQYLRQIPAAVAEMKGFLARRARGRVDALPPEAVPEAFPEYYRRTFHWQRGGWLSDDSARLYDVSVEFLFLGAADITRRMVLPSLIELPCTRPNILDVGCGTGRTLLQLHAARPNAQLHGLDLSPNYLAFARRSLQPLRWLSLVHGRAEAMHFRDESFDAVTSTFLFHEVPGDVRRQILSEMYRVLRPGGRLVVCDSLQLHDGEGRTRHWLTTFPLLYHEPFFANYVSEPLEQLVSEAGFQVEKTERAYVSKVLVARRPVEGALH